MQLNLVVAAAVIAVTLAVVLPAGEAFNITRILAKDPKFSDFNRALSTTHLADDINTRRTITVCAVDNAGMADLLSRHLSPATLKNVLSVHILLDYFGAEKLHKITNGSALLATMYQATGAAPGAAGFVNITDMKGGKVGFGSVDNGGEADATFVKSIDEQPYNISVIQISSVLPSPDAEAPTAAPSDVNITAAMSAHGCKTFADTLASSPAEKTFEDNLNSGLTIFCPADDAMKAFLPKFKNLTKSQQQSLLEYHGVPIYHTMAMLKSDNGPTNTLATDGAQKFSITVQNDGAMVTLKTTVVTAKVSNNLLDQDPVSIFTVSKVLMPTELFKPELSPTPAPAPAPEKSPKKKKKSKTPPAADSPSDSPADAPDGDVDDQIAADDSGAGSLTGRFAGVCFSVFVAFLLL